MFEQMILHELSEQEYRTKKAVLDTELSRLQAVQAAVSTQLSQRQTDEQAKSANERLAQKVVSAEGLSSDLVAELIDRVYVYPDKNIEIVWKVAGFGSDEMIL